VVFAAAGFAAPETACPLHGPEGAIARGAGGDASKHSRTGLQTKSSGEGQSFFCFFERMLVTTAIRTPTPKIRVPITLT